MTRRAAAAAALTVALTSSLAAQSPDSTTSLELHLRVGGRTRHYLVDLPPRYVSRGPMPLVFNFHGGGGSPKGARTQSGFSALGARVGAILVYPAGSGRVSDERLLTWNTGSCCGLAAAQKIDETAFVRALIDTLEHTYSIDRNRIYGTGLSNGGMMAHLVGCTLADRFAAIAVISGELSMDCHPSRPVSVLIVHGTADENLPYDGGVGRKALDKHEVKPVSFAVDSWKAFDKCATGGTTTTQGVVTHSMWPCADGTVLELYKIEGGGHSWPGGQRMLRILDVPSDALNATQVAWDFFAAHPRHN